MNRKSYGLPADDVMRGFWRLGYRPNTPNSLPGSKHTGTVGEKHYWKFLFWKFYWRCNVPESDWYTLDVVEVVAETEGAFLLTFEDAKGEEFSDWFPKSMIDEPDRYKKGDKDCGIAVRRWLAERKGIVDD